MPSAYFSFSWSIFNVAIFINFGCLGLSHLFFWDFLAKRAAGVGAPFTSAIRGLCCLFYGPWVAKENGSRPPALRCAKSFALRAYELLVVCSATSGSGKQPWGVAGEYLSSPCAGFVGKAVAM